MRKTTALTLLGALAVLSVAITPLIVAVALPATEVERIKDYYYFRIHGQNIQNPVDTGIAEFVYKNLSPDTQVVEIIMNGIPKGGSPTPGNLFTGDELFANGQTVYFQVEINGLEVFSGSIWIPPNN